MGERVIWIRADSDTEFNVRMFGDRRMGTQSQFPGNAGADHYYAYIVDSAATVALYGTLEDIHSVLMRGISDVLHLWTDPTHQPGEPADTSDTTAPHLPDVPA